MKKLLLFIVLLLVFDLSSKAQVVSIVPNRGLQGQTQLYTTATLASGVLTNATPPMGGTDVYLQQGSTIINSYYSYWNGYYDINLNQYVWYDYGTCIWNIPANAPTGLYDVVVLTYPPGVWPLIPDTNRLLGGFEIDYPAGSISGSLYFDINQNGVRDSGEPPVANHRIEIAPIGTFAFTNYLGNYDFIGDTGTYTISYTPPGTFTQTSSPLTYNLTLPPSHTGKDFGTYSSSALYYHSNYVSVPRARCLTTSPIHPVIQNQGYMSVQDRFYIITSSNNPYNSSNVTPDYMNGDTIMYTTPIIPPFSNYSPATIYYDAPAAGQTISYTFIDSVFDNNGIFIAVYIQPYSYTVRCSYDPNDKHVSPEGVSAQHFTPMNSELTFLVNFQNTGNDTAYNIHILDTLDSDLDLSSFELIAGSHDVTVQMTPAGALRFNFLNIMLPDSNIDEAGSHGWVMYKISPKAGLADPTEITNTAHIVFDQNTPVVTNTTLNTLTNLQHPQANFTTADVTICETNCILYTNQSTSGTTYAWSFPGGTPSSSTSSSPGAICYPNAGAYDVTLITTNAMGSDTLTQAAYINVAQSPAIFTVAQVGDSLISPQGYSTYQWYYNNVLISGATSYFYVATQNGNYGVVVGNPNGCETGVNIPNVVTGIDNISTSDAISVYPNPAANSFVISFVSNDDQSVMINVYDKVGQLVQSKEIRTSNDMNKITMNSEELSSGIYSIRLTSKSKVFTKSIMINK